MDTKTRIAILLLTLIATGGALFWMYTATDAPPAWLTDIRPVSPPFNLPPPTRPTPPPMVTPPPVAGPPPSFEPSPAQPPTQPPPPPPPSSAGSEPPPPPPPPPAQTANASLFFDPFFISVGPSEPFSVDVKLDTGGDSVVAVSAYIQFDDDLLFVDDIDVGGSVFSIEAETLLYPGEIRLSRGMTPPGYVGADGLIATIRFSPKRSGFGELYFLWDGPGAGPSRVMAQTPAGVDILRNLPEMAYDIR